MGFVDRGPKEVDSLMDGGDSKTSASLDAVLSVAVSAAAKQLV